MCMQMALTLATQYRHDTSGAQPDGYGVGAKCVRSHSPYTRWWWNYGDGFNESGLTLYQTNEQDLATPFGDNNYDVKVKDAWDEPWTTCWDNAGFRFSDMGACNAAGHGGCVCNSGVTHHPDEYETRYCITLTVAQAELTGKTGTAIVSQVKHGMNIALLETIVFIYATKKA